METLNVSGVTLQGFAQGGIRTCIAIPEIKAMFDLGSMLPISMKYDKVFITHGHTDHTGQLSTFVSRREIQDLKPPDIYAPAQIVAPTLKKILELWSFMNNPSGKGYRSYNANIHPVNIGDEIPLSKNHTVKVMPTYHVGISNGYCVIHHSKKLKQEYVGKPGSEIAAAAKSGADLYDRNDYPLLCIPGDTKIEFLLNHKEAQKCKVLVHEVTFWESNKKVTVEGCRRRGHTHVDEMIAHCEKFEGEALVLCHRSLRFSRKEIEQIVAKRFPSEIKNKIHIFDGGDRNV